MVSVRTGFVHNSHRERLLICEIRAWPHLRPLCGSRLHQRVTLRRPVSDSYSPRIQREHGNKPRLKQPQMGFVVALSKMLYRSFHMDIGAVDLPFLHGHHLPFFTSLRCKDMELGAHWTPPWIAYRLGRTAGRMITRHHVILITDLFFTSPPRPRETFWLQHCFTAAFILLTTPWSGSTDNRFSCDAARA